MQSPASDITIHLTIPAAVVAITRDERDVTGVNKDIRHRIEYLLWEEGAYLKRYPPKKQNGNIDEMMKEVLGNRPETGLKEAFASTVKPEPKPEPKKYEPHPLAWNNKGPIVDSRIIIDIIKKLLEYGHLTEWEYNFLAGEGDENGNLSKMESAMMYVNTYFTWTSGAIFQRLCYRAGIECPFYIAPGQTKPPADWNA
jgi:hypothetical protein